jgi:hypothetical protein
MADAEAFSLEDCAEVCARCQHKAATAMTSYVRKALTRLSNTDGDAEDAGEDTRVARTHSSRDLRRLFLSSLCKPPTFDPQRATMSPFEHLCVSLAWELTSEELQCDYWLTKWESSHQDKHLRLTPGIRPYARCHC